MPPWLLPAIGMAADAAMGLLSSSGQAKANRQNRDQAREQMQFQERMSSTAAQRSRADYERAGLNPALAYERTASTPGGASATMLDAATSGINTAQTARRTRNDMRIANQMHQENLRNVRADTEVKARQGVLIEKQQQAQELANRFQFASQPFDLRLRAAQALLNEASIPGATNKANIQRIFDLGISPVLNGAQAVRRVLDDVGRLYQQQRRKK